MTGRYKIEARDRKVSYELDIKKNITIVAGNSATGKSYFVSMIDMFYRNPYLATVKIFSEGKEVNVPLFHISTVNWELIISKTLNSIIVFDGSDDFVIEEKEKFIELVKNSDNYFIIINRYLFPELPYSIKELCVFEETVDKGTMSGICNKLQPLSL